MPTANILSYTALARTVTILLEDGTITTVPVLVDFSYMIGQTIIYENGVLTITPQPPVAIVYSDPATVIEGALIYNVTIPALKIGYNNGWISL